MFVDHLPHDSPLGRIVRWPLRLIPPERPRRILTGTGAGLWWYPAAGPHGIWLGLYERRTLRVFAAAVRPNATVWDVGAHAGLYALIAARAGARIMVFEPLATNVRWLRCHLALNGLRGRAQVHPIALGARSARSGFLPDPSRMRGKLAAGSGLTVEVRSADQLDLPAPALIKIDVEGAELEVLEGAARAIRAARPTIVLEVHAPVTVADCLERLPA